MIFDISFSVFNFFFLCFSSIFTFAKQSFLGIFYFGLKQPQIARVVEKMVNIINLSYYLSHFIKKKSTFQR